MIKGRLPAPPRVASEAIVVLDLVESTEASDLYGWYAVGRGLMRDLRACILRVARHRGRGCMKSTGDGYLLTFVKPTAADRAAFSAVEACFAILNALEERNRQQPKQHAINVRIAVHFGEVDVIDNDREGPNVAFTFRLESITRESFKKAVNAVAPQKLPLRNYILCSEQVAKILTKRPTFCKTTKLALLALKGFSGKHEVYRLSR